MKALLARRLGDVVFGQASGCLGTAVVSPALTVVAQPPGISATEACTIPTVFLTADACLHEAAGIRPGDRCLIHAATGMCPLLHAALRASNLFVLGTPGRLPAPVNQRLASSVMQGSSC